jgi:hypothetical protein
MKTIMLTRKAWKLFNELLKTPSEPTPELCALLHGKKVKSKYPPHKYQMETTCGIGFCKVCGSDDMNDGNHIID